MADNKNSATTLCGTILGNSVFETCSLDMTEFMEACKADIAECLDTGASISSCTEDYACAQGSLYATQCGMRGGAVVVPQWRLSVDECSITCPAGQTFRTCIDACNKYCENHPSVACLIKVCEEGCECNNGTKMLDDYGEFKCVVPGDCW